MKRKLGRGLEGELTHLKKELNDVKLTIRELKSKCDRINNIIIILTEKEQLINQRIDELTKENE